MIKIQENILISNQIQQNLIETNTTIKEMEELAKIGKDLPQMKSLLGNYILENSSVIFAAERGTGKTLLGLQL